MRIRRAVPQFSVSLESFERLAPAALAVAAATGIMFLVGRDVLGEGVIALLYLVPISWSTARWGQGPGIVAAITAALAFNFFFIPPYYTLYIGSLEGWLLLGIFLAVAIVVVRRIQSGLSHARAREREAIFMYELSAALASARTPEVIAHLLAEKVQQVSQAAGVQVFIERNSRSFVIDFPRPVALDPKPDLILPILVVNRVEGELRLWQGEVRLPPADDRLLNNFANQGALALERARLAQIQAHPEWEGVK